MKLAYDITQMRPASPEVAKSLGADANATLWYFPNELWITYPSPNMQVYEVNEDQIGEILKQTFEKHKGGVK